MMKIRFGMVGAGWRGEFFARIAQELPEQFELTGTWLHSPEKAEAWQKRFGGRIARTPAELLEDKPDFLVQAVAKTALTGMLMELMDLEVPILCETTPFIPVSYTHLDVYKRQLTTSSNHAILIHRT